MPQVYLDKIYNSIWKLFPFVSLDYHSMYGFYEDRLIAKCYYKNHLHEKHIVIKDECFISATPQTFDAVAKHMTEELLSYFTNIVMEDNDRGTVDYSIVKEK